MTLEVQRHVRIRATVHNIREKKVCGWSIAVFSGRFKKPTGGTMLGAAMSSRGVSSLGSWVLCVITSNLGRHPVGVAVARPFHLAAYLENKIQARSSDHLA
jgi:hypothetical protein